MEGKISDPGRDANGRIKLYSSDGAQIGETFTRRARQLVKQQRAEWMDDSHTAVQFFPDAEDFSADEPVDIPLPRSPYEAGDLYEIASRRVKMRRTFVWHTIVLIPGFIFFFLIAMILYDFRYHLFAFFFMGVTCGIWGWHYLCRAIRLYKSYGNSDFFKGTSVYSYWETRRAMAIAAELERLKRNGAFLRH